VRLLTLFRLPLGIAVLVGLGAAVNGTWWLVLLALLAAAMIYVLGRDPARDVPSQPLGIVSPVDGRVAASGVGQDPFLGREALVIELQQGVFASAILSSPTEGRIEQIWAGPDMPGFDEGRRLAIHLSTDEGDEVVLVIGRPRSLRGPLRWSVQPGERVGQGQRRGVAGWGRCVTLYLPPGSTAAPAAGLAVQAGSSQLCQLMHAE
jgi:phosphatidylserine decarboxylase